MTNKLTEVDAQTSFEYHVKVKAELLVLENEEPLAIKLT